MTDPRDGPRVDTGRSPIDLLAEEFLRRVRGGEALEPAAFAREHPQHAAELVELLPTLLLLETERRERERESSGPASRRAALPPLERLGDYRLLREVGRGGMGVVFEAMQESLGRRVALKVLPQATLMSGNQLERFRREAQVAARLHHTNIVPVYGSGETDGFHYYAMQFIDGQGLDALVRRQREPGLASDPAAVRTRATFAARVGASVAAALQHAHEQGTLHRDVKPANLLLERNEHVWVTDFGLAKALQQDALTHSGDVLGTLQYMAPEQLDGRYDARSEVYALGATLFELVALRPAFTAGSRSELLDKIRRGRGERLEQLSPGVPVDLATILARALAVEPERRYADAAAFGADLVAFLEDRPIAARRLSGPARLWRFCRRNRALAVTSAVALLAVVGAAVVGWGAFWTTSEALAREAESGNQAKAARLLAEGNLGLALLAFEDVFDTLVGPDPLHALTDDSDEDDGGAVVALRAPLADDELGLLQRMLAFYDRFLADNADNQALREQTARAYRRVGSIQARLGDLASATHAFEQSLQRYRDTIERDVTRDLAAVQQELGVVHVRSGKMPQAEGCFRQSLQLLEADAADGSRSARLLRARAHYLLASNFRAPPGRRGGPPGPRRDEPRPDRPPDAGGRPRPDRPPDAAGLERLRASRAHLESAQELLTALLAGEPQDVEALFLRARCLQAEVRLQPRREAREANEQEAQAIAILEQLVAARPDQDAFRFELAAALLPRPGPEPGPVDASKLPVAVAHAEELVARQPRHPEYLGLAGRAHGALAMAKLAASDLPAAEAEIRAAIVHESALLRGKQRNERFLMQLVRSGMLLARVLTASGQGARIDTELQPVVAVLVQVAADEGLTLDPTTLQGAFTALPEARPRGPRELPRALQELHNKLRRR